MPLTNCEQLLGDLESCTDNAVWISPVSSLANRMSNASFNTPRSLKLADADEVNNQRLLLLNESVKFGVDDSNDSIHQFLQRAGSPDDSADWELGQVADTPCRALTFCSSPSQPAPLCQRERLSAQQLHRLASAPAFSPAARRQKRQSPDVVAVGNKPATPKRRRLQPLGDLTNAQPPRLLHRCFSEASGRLDSARIDKAISSIDSLNLVGNSEQSHSLPTVKELNFGIRYVSPFTVSRLLRGEFSVGDYRIIDCRYPYEFEGGHIRGAENIFTQADLMRRVMQQESGRRPLLIFHCEFSSERAPKLARFLRQHDREINAQNYPQLNYPEVYVLQGGYKAFYEAHKEFCLPLLYTKMADTRYKGELAKFQKASRAWDRQNSRSRHSQLERLARHC